MLSVNGLVGLNGTAHFELVADLSALIAVRLNCGGWRNSTNAAVSSTQTFAVMKIESSSSIWQLDMRTAATDGFLSELP